MTRPVNREKCSTTATQADISLPTPILNTHINRSCRAQCCERIPTHRTTMNQGNPVAIRHAHLHIAHSHSVIRRHSWRQAYLIATSVLTSRVYSGRWKGRMRLTPVSSEMIASTVFNASNLLPGQVHTVITTTRTWSIQLVLGHL